MQARSRLDVLIASTDLPLRRGRQPLMAEVCGDIVVLSVPCYEHSAAGRGTKALAAVVAAIVRGEADEHPGGGR